MRINKSKTSQQIATLRVVDQVQNHKQIAAQLKQLKLAIDDADIHLVGLQPLEAVIETKTFDEDSYYNIEAFRKLGYQWFTLAKKRKLSDFHVEFHGTSDEQVLAFFEGLMLSDYSFDKYKTKKNDFTVKSLSTNSSVEKAAFDALTHLCDAVKIARDLVNEPLSFLTATQYSKEMTKIGKDTGFNVEVLEKSKIESLKMGGLLAVNLGSFDPPTFNICEYKPKKAVNKKPLVLVGKGIVFDTGGLSLKPTKDSMDLMKIDMAGSAAVIGTMAAIAKNKLPIYVICLVPATDNRPGNNAYVPGDVIKMFDGSTVEVLNTDAEGRMVLADALSYAKKYDPELVIDAATLTGAAVRAVAPHAMAVMSTADSATNKNMMDAGWDSFERFVEFPLWKEFKDMIQSDIADIKNVGGASAGMITAGKFLEHFTDYPWIHIDLVLAWNASAKHYQGKNGTGGGVRALYSFVKKQYNL